MKFYNYLFCEVSKRYDAGLFERGETEIIEVCPTLEKALNVMSAYYGAYYDAEGVAADVRKSNTGRGPWVRDMRNGRRKEKWVYNRYYRIIKVERH